MNLKPFQVFIDTRTNFQYTLTKAYSQEVIGGTLVKYQPNLGKRSRRTKAMFTIGGRVLNDIVVQIVPESKNAVSNFFLIVFFYQSNLNSQKRHRSNVSIKWEFYIRKAVLLAKRSGLWEKTGRWTSCKPTKSQSSDVSSAIILAVFLSVVTFSRCM